MILQKCKTMWYFIFSSNVFVHYFPASLAVEAGVAGIIVSNHGARQLDYVPATITALEEVVKASRGRVPVFLDGGIRRGTDVFKALALGASGVFVSSKKKKQWLSMFAVLFFLG